MLSLITQWQNGEREKGGLKLLYQLMEKSKHFSNPNLNKMISSFFASYVTLLLNEKVKVIEAKEKDLNNDAV
jgi:hypothetical protein